MVSLSFISTVDRSLFKPTGYIHSGEIKISSACWVSGHKLGPMNSVVWDCSDSGQVVHTHASCHHSSSNGFGRTAAIMFAAGK